MKPSFQSGKAISLTEKIAFLKEAKTYPDATKVEALETHMSWVFLTDRYVYKLKKPVVYDFLDFSSLESRYKFCKEEVTINQALAGDTYIGVLPLKSYHGSLQLNGKGAIVDWLIKMKRLPEKYLLDTAIKEGTAREEWVQRAAELLVHFYLDSKPVKPDPEFYRQQMIKSIKTDSKELLCKQYKLHEANINDLKKNLLSFLEQQAGIFEERLAEGRVIEGHGDLRPEHIFLGVRPLIIDRVEFNRDLRIIDIAEELSFLAMECELLDSTVIGQLFFNTYIEKSGDKIPENLIFFFKAKRAYLRARLSIHHLREKKYLADEQKWKSRCETYLKVASSYCKKFGGK